MEQFPEDASIGQVNVCILGQQCKKPQPVNGEPIKVLAIAENRRLNDTIGR